MRKLPTSPSEKRRSSVRMSRQSPWIRIPVSEAKEGSRRVAISTRCWCGRRSRNQSSSSRVSRVVDQVQVVEDDRDRLGGRGERVEQPDQDLVADLRVGRLGRVAHRLELAGREDRLERGEDGEPEPRAVVVGVERDPGGARRRRRGGRATGRAASTCRSPAGRRGRRRARGWRRSRRAGSSALRARHGPAADGTSSAERARRSPSGPSAPHSPCFERLRLAQVESLREVDPVLAQDLDRLVVADELGDRLAAEAAGDLDQGADDELVGLGVGQVLDELAVDLQVVELEVLEVVEGGEAGAEVVEREAAARGRGARGRTAWRGRRSRSRRSR